MSVKIEEVNIKRFFKDKNVKWVLGDVNILVGKNGKGKSILLNIIHHLLQGREDKALLKCESATIKLTNNRILSRNNSDKTSEILEGFTKFILTEFTNKKNIARFIKNNKGKTEEQIKDDLESIISAVNSKGVEAPSGFFMEMGPNKPEVHEKINTCYISTINMNANSNSEVKKSSGGKTTILTMETESEISDLLANEDDPTLQASKVKDKALLESILNDLFKETNKKLVIDTNFKIEDINSHDEFEIDDLSSGEKQLIYTLIKVANSKRENQVILMDEPEISLHLSWQEKLLSSIKKIRPDSQIIVVTHSPGILMGGWMGCYQEIDNILHGVE